MSSQKSRVWSVVSVVLVLLLSAAALLLWWQRQYVRDVLVVGQYQPTDSIQRIAEQAGMSERGIFLFYASQPQLNTAEQFNQHCKRQEAASAILGCYDGQYIYIYDVNHPDLQGVEEVTAAHEMLHAAWNRLSTREQNRLAGLLETAYQNVRSDELDERLAYYERTQPGERANELHSILGTEAGDVGEELERHFAVYFHDRSTIVAAHQAYSTVFTEAKSRSESLYAQLSELSTSIESETRAYNSTVESLNTQIIALNVRATTIDRSNASAVYAFNADRTALLARVQESEVVRMHIDEQTATYNELLEEYNALAIRSYELMQSLDSTLAPSPQL